MQAGTVRDMLRRATVATLATLDAGSGHPYASLVEVATLPDATPVLLLSALARHTRNLASDARASLLVDERGASPAPLTGQRATLLGRLAPSDDPAGRQRYEARFPASRAYASFQDFGFWTLTPTEVHVIAGFGRIATLPGTELILAVDQGPFSVRQEADFLASVNAILKAAGRPATALGIDPEGVDWQGPAGATRITFGHCCRFEDLDARSIASSVAQAL